MKALELRLPRVDYVMLVIINLGQIVRTPAISWITQKIFAALCCLTGL